MKAEKFHKKEKARRDLRMAEIKMTMNDYKEAKEFLTSALKSIREMEKERGAKSSD